MTLGEKIRYLREVEGSLRGLGRPMTQLELVRAIAEEAEGRKQVPFDSAQGKPHRRFGPVRDDKEGAGKGGRRGAGKGPSKAPSKAPSQTKTISQSYLSQIENGTRPHMTQSSRALLAKFFKVHPGFLVDDPEGYHAELTSDLRTMEGQLDVWLLQGSERFASDPEVSQVLIKAAREKDTRRCLLLLGAILDTPGLAERLLEALRPELAGKTHC